MNYKSTDLKDERNRHNKFISFIFLQYICIKERKHNRKLFTDEFARAIFRLRELQYLLEVHTNKCPHLLSRLSSRNLGKRKNTKSRGVTVLVSYAFAVIVKITEIAQQVREINEGGTSLLPRVNTHDAECACA